MEKYQIEWRLELMAKTAKKGGARMSESEISKKLTKAIKAVDKFISEGRKVAKALKVLKESSEKGGE